MTPKQIESYKRWFDKTVRKCKTCGNSCILTERKEKMSKKILITMNNCSKCKMLKEQCPDVESVELQPNELLAFARAVSIQSMPFAVILDPTTDDLK